MCVHLTLPICAGFDTFFGYYAAALRDYWYHGGGLGCKYNGTAHNSYITDLSNSTLSEVSHADDKVNGTYDQELFTAEAVRIIDAHAAGARETNALNGGDAKSSGLYIYLAYQNVHCTAQSKATLSGAQPLHAPCTTVDTHYGKTALDTYKVMGSMITELDYGVGNVTAALDASGLPYVLVLSADNGGPLEHSTNAPLRGGKHTVGAICT
jgi:hypothetical protein